MNEEMFQRKREIPFSFVGTKKRRAKVSKVPLRKPNHGGVLEVLIPFMISRPNFHRTFVGICKLTAGTKLMFTNASID